MPRQSVANLKRISNAKDVGIPYRFSSQPRHSAKAFMATPFSVGIFPYFPELFSFASSKFSSISLKAEKNSSCAKNLIFRADFDKFNNEFYLNRLRLVVFVDESWKQLRKVGISSQKVTFEIQHFLLSWNREKRKMQAEAPFGSNLWLPKALQQWRSWNQWTDSAEQTQSID